MNGAYENDYDYREGGRRGLSPPHPSFQGGDQADVDDEGEDGCWENNGRIQKGAPPSSRVVILRGAGRRPSNFF